MHYHFAIPESGFYHIYSKVLTVELQGSLFHSNAAILLHILREEKQDGPYLVNTFKIALPDFPYVLLLTNRLAFKPH